MMSDKPLEAEVIIQCKKKGLEEARKGESGLVLWTDGSKLDQGQAAAAICWEDTVVGRWKEKSIFLGWNKEILDAELWAVSEALNVVEKIVNAKTRR